MRRIIPLLFLTLVLAGCHEPAPRNGGSDAAGWEIRGTFTENATQDDLEDLRMRLEPYDAEMRVLESFPMQYHVTGPRIDDCPDVEELLRDRLYVADVGTCMVREPTNEGDEPTGSPEA